MPGNSLCFHQNQLFQTGNTDLCLLLQLLAADAIQRLIGCEIAFLQQIDGHHAPVRKDGIEKTGINRFFPFHTFKIHVHSLSQKILSPLRNQLPPFVNLRSVVNHFFSFIEIIFPKYTVFSANIVEKDFLQLPELSPHLRNRTGCSYIARNSPVIKLRKRFHKLLCHLPELLCLQVITYPKSRNKLCISVVGQKFQVRFAAGCNLTENIFTGKAQKLSAKAFPFLLHANQHGHKLLIHFIRHLFLSDLLCDFLRIRCRIVSDHIPPEHFLDQILMRNPVVSELLQPELLLILNFLGNQLSDNLFQVLPGNWLQKIIKAPVFDGLLCVGKIGIAGQENNLRAQLLRTNPFQQVKAVFNRHFDVTDQKIDLRTSQCRFRLFYAVDTDQLFDSEGLPVQLPAKKRYDVFVIIHNQQLHEFPPVESESLHLLRQSHCRTM